MSNVTTYIVFRNYDEEETQKVVEKLIELSDEFVERTDIPRVAQAIIKTANIRVSEFGNKSPEFDKILFFGFNYFPDDEFDAWFYKQNFEDVQVLRSKENDDKFTML